MVRGGFLSLSAGSTPGRRSSAGPGAGPGWWAWPRAESGRGAPRATGPGAGQDRTRGYAPVRPRGSRVRDAVFHDHHQQPPLHRPRLLPFCSLLPTTPVSTRRPEIREHTPHTAVHCRTTCNRTDQTGHSEQVVMETLHWGGPSCVLLGLRHRGGTADRATPFSSPTSFPQSPADTGCSLGPPGSHPS